jgi:hypothetical protein
VLVKRGKLMRRPARLTVWFRLLVFLSMLLSGVGPAAPAFAQSLAGLGGPPTTVNTTQPAGVTPSGASAGIPTGTPVEVPGRRTRTSQTFRVGTHYETRIYQGSVNYQDAHGAWQPIDDTLVADTAAGYAFTNQANRYQVHLPAKLGGAPVRVDVGNAWVQFALVGATTSTAATNAATASYANALPGVTVTYTAGNDLLKEDLVLASAGAPHSFVYTLQSHGLTAKADGHGGVAFLDGTGQPQFGFAAPSMQDSSKAPSGVSHAVTLTLGAGAAGQTVTLAADPGWLASPARRYPVTIDPTVYFNSVPFTGTNADCYFANGAQANSSCGHSELYAGYDGTSVYRSLLDFNIASGYSIAMPSNVNVLEASVNLYLASKGVAGTGLPVELRQVTQPWTTYASWNTTDGTTPWTTPGGTYTASPLWTTTVGPTTGQWYAWYLTSLVQGWTNGGVANDGLEVKAADEGTTDWVGFDSDESGAGQSYFPYLNVKWEPWLGAKGYSTVNSYPLTDRMGMGVNVANGNLMLQANDLDIAGTGLPLVVDRIYNNVSVLSWDVGNSWDFDTGSDIFLVLNGNGQGDGADIYGADWGVYFPRNPDGSFTSPTGIDATLVR